MTTRKRKSPDKRKPARKEPGFLLLAAQASMRLCARNPARFTSTVGFVVVMGFVAANAFWYQPGRHPSPFLRTRDPHDFTAMLGLNSNHPLKPDPDDVTTFRIQRQTAENTPVSPAPGAVGSATGVLPATDTGADPLTAGIQAQLIRLGLYDGAADGKRGPRTDAAISAYQRRIGVPVTGAPSDDLLAALSVDQKSPAVAPPKASAPPVRPMERPVQVTATADDAIDPVAAAIRNAEKTVTTAQSAPVRPNPTRLPTATPVSTAAASTVKTQSGALAKSATTANAPVPQAPVASASLVTTGANGTGVNGTGASEEASLIMDIQRGLINIAYTDISVDGVAGDKTKAAIRHFERHYRLPETGEPNMAVLKKLKSIGAL
ncbi:peptidoglycan-binding protein [Agrobacterium vitis]|uniref:peptidoglycan-binding domain-containing protein n=1 Tax=Agrobacterium vitis TaxID=373 RepID=UPI0012E96016|nr:peptidoglycan-binding domain-containing protein [Agrobacterium vitis]MVA24402.1 peptidoglycan-binding protein [Agrobacterium vitis]